MLTYGEYGGRFVPETLIPALDELEAGWRAAREDPAYQAELDELGRSYAGRPTPLTLAERFAPGKRLYLKREDLLHTGAHKLNNALGQALLALRLGKRRIVAETGAGQHGVATATVCARFGLECVVYMGSEDMRRQRPNVERMGLLGAEVRPVEFGTKTLKEATSEAIRDWIGSVETTHYLIGSCVGPEPYPQIVGALQAVIGREAREQLLEAEGRLPEVALACVGGGSNAIGLFAAFVDDAEVRLVGVEAGGAASLGSGRPAVLHGSRSSVLADEDGQVLDAHSISAGLDYPGVGPEHAFLRDSGRAEYVGTSDEEALAAFRRLARTEGILPALEPAHALARVAELDEELILLCLSGRGDKDRGRGHGEVTEPVGWDPERAASFYDEYGESEWTRFEDGRTPAPSLDVHLDRLRRFVSSGDRVLEVGAGPGRFTIELARLGAKVSVSDLSPGQLELNRQRVAAEGLEAQVVERELADLLDLSRWDDASFDATVCFGGPLSYVVDRADEGIAELVRVTRPGGHVLVSVMSLVGTVTHYLPILLDLVRRDGVAKNDAIVRTGLLPDEPDYGHLAMKLFRWSELEALLSPHGTVVESCAAGLLPTVQPEEPELRAFVSRVELELAGEPGAVSCGQHILAVLRREP